MGDEKSQDHAEAAGECESFSASAPLAITGRILCIGGAALDTTFLAQQPIVTGTSNPAVGSEAFGGVARNVAENLARLGVEAGLVSRVGEDANGRRLVRHLTGLGIDTRGIASVPGARTAAYMALLEPDRTLNIGVADMAIFDGLDVELLRASPMRLDADWIFADCNSTADLLEALLRRQSPLAGRIAVDGVSVAKARRLPPSLDGLDLLFINLDEAASVLGVPQAGLEPEDVVARLRGRGVGAVVLTLGPDGLLAGNAAGCFTRIPALATEVADVTGAGDALVATTLAARLAGLALPLAVRWGCIAASLTLERVGSTRPDLSFTLLREHAARSFAMSRSTP